MRFRHGLIALLLLLPLVACGTGAPTESASDSLMPPADGPTIVGTITELDEWMLVEQQPGATIGEKIYFRLDDRTTVFQRAGEAVLPRGVSDVALGQRVEVWTDLVETSYLGFATAKALVITGPAEAPTPTPGAVELPTREPDIVGILTGAANTVTIDNDLTFLITPTTRFAIRRRDMVRALDPRDIEAGQPVALWLGEIDETSLRQIEVLVIEVVGE